MAESEERDGTTPEDPLPVLIAAIDQAAMMAPQIARAAKSQYDAYVNEGFTPSQAVYLVAVAINENDLGTP